MPQTTPVYRALVWGVLGLAALVNAAGYLFDLYRRYWWFDKVLHPYTIFALTLALALSLYGLVLTGAPRHRLLLVLVIASIGLALGALWEVAEWGYDRVVPGNIIKGKTDTITDLIVDAVGALAAGVLATHLAPPARPDAP